MTALADRAEELHADRMAALVELARLRGLTLPVLMDQLGISYLAQFQPNDARHRNPIDDVIPPSGSFGLMPEISVAGF